MPFPKPKSGKPYYFCRPCKRSHMRNSIIGHLHKAYFESAGPK